MGEKHCEGQKARREKRKEKENTRANNWVNLFHLQVCSVEEREPERARMSSGGLQFS